MLLTFFFIVFSVISRNAHQGNKYKRKMIKGKDIFIFTFGVSAVYYDLCVLWT